MTETGDVRSVPELCTTLCGFGEFSLYKSSQVKSSSL